MRLGITVAIIKGSTKEQTLSETLKRDGRAVTEMEICCFTQRRWQEAEESRRKGKTKKDNDVVLQLATATRETTGQARS